MHNKQKHVPAVRKLALALTAATLLTSAFSGIAQAQYGYHQSYGSYGPYGYYDGDLTRYNVPAEQHQWYDRGNTDFNS